VVLVGVGLYLRERAVVIFGSIVLALGLLSVVDDIESVRYLDPTPFWNAGFFLALVATGTLGVLALLFRRFSEEGDTPWAMLTRKGMLVMFSLGVIAGTLTLSYELALIRTELDVLPWLVMGAGVLLVGLRFRSRLLEVAGWVIAILSSVTTIEHVDRVQRAYLRSSDPTALASLPFLNFGTLLLLFLVLVPFCFLFAYRRYSDASRNVASIVSGLLIIANLFVIGSVTSEIAYMYDRKSRVVDVVYNAQAKETRDYTGRSNISFGEGSKEEFVAKRNIENSKQVVTILFWVLYSTVMVVIGFARRRREIRLFGLVFFFLTTGRIFLQIFSNTNQLGRIITLIVFGLVALGTSFLYVKYKDRIIHE
jgi:uncharacterized membrane protein